MLNFCGILHFNAHLLLTLDKETFTEEDKNKKVGLVVKDKVRLSHAGESKAVPMNPATGVVIALLISVVLAVAGKYFFHQHSFFFGEIEENNYLKI